MKQSLLLILGTSSLMYTPFALAADSSQPAELESVVIIGTSEDAQTLPGSGSVVDQEQLEAQVATDINQVLKTVPGVYIREEEGNGLRPNIGIRGATSERSGKITLLEDGVLMAPAPYSNPEAYYFPTTTRMSAIEVIKGAPLLRYGPQTTGGVVNLVSTPIPETEGGSALMMFDERGSTDLHAHYGERNDGFLYQIETVQRDSAGYKSIDRSSRDSGYDISDYVIKFGWEGDRQKILFKGQYSEEISNETYLGLSDRDFAVDPNRRYGLSSIDQMDNQHDSINIFHSFEWTQDLTQHTTLYRNQFQRNWFKLGGGADLVEQANAGDATAIGILNGSEDTTGLVYTNNNRAYVSEGISTRFDLAFSAHLLQAGVRIHQDTMDRIQPQDVYDQVNGDLVFQSVVEPTGGNNREEKADALSYWLADDWQVTDKLNTQLVLRYEDVESSRIQYADVDRGIIDSTRSNNSSELLPGASFTYDMNDNWQVLAGVHKGFSPLGGGASVNDEPETSENYEAGFRYNTDLFAFETIGFYSDFSNQAELCSLASPCSNGDTSGRFITGEAEIAGVELLAQRIFQLENFAVPVQLAYTHTQAEVSQTNADFNAGDQLKDIPENIFSLSAGLEQANGWNSYAIAKYQDEMCVTTGCNNNADTFDRTDSLFTLDLVSHIPVNERTQFIVKAENVLDEQKIVSRSPDGARPNKPLTVSMGVQVDL